jgi:hypothetical protein
MYALIQKKRPVAARRSSCGSFAPAQGMQRQRISAIVRGETIQRQANDRAVGGDCSGYESDRESFAWVVARHHIQEETGTLPDITDTWCSTRDPVCLVTFAGDTSVFVSFFKVPEYVIARTTGRETQTRRYAYRCDDPVGSPRLTPVSR